MRADLANLETVLALSLRSTMTLSTVVWGKVTTALSWIPNTEIRAKHVGYRSAVCSLQRDATLVVIPISHP